MADDEKELVVTEEVDKQRKFWFQAGQQYAVTSFSVAMNSWLDSLEKQWKLLVPVFGQELDAYEKERFTTRLTELVEDVNYFGNRLIYSELPVYGRNDEDEVDSEYETRVVSNYVELCFGIYKKLHNNPKEYLAVFGCRKRQHFHEIQFSYAHSKEVLKKFGADAWNRTTTTANGKHLYEIISEEPGRLGSVFENLPTSKILDECICQECKACCGRSGCICKYEHQEWIECEESLDDECDQNNHYKCVNCENCECC